MANVDSLMILSGITIITGVSLWMLEKTPKKETPKKRSPKRRSPTPEPSPMKEEIKTPLPTIRKTPPKIPRAITPKVKTPKAITPKVKTPKAKTPKAKTVQRAKTPPRAKTPREKTPEPRVKFVMTPRPILKRTRRRLSDNSISSTDATIHTEATDRKNL